jgi:hypothetical protein
LRLSRQIISEQALILRGNLGRRYYGKQKNSEVSAVFSCFPLFSYEFINCSNLTQLERSTEMRIFRAGNRVSSLMGRWATVNSVCTFSTSIASALGTSVS